MDLSSIPAGKAPPWDINVIVEIPMQSDTADQDALGTAPACYPGHFGFIPHTLTAGEVPLDVLVVGSVAVLPGSVLRARPIGTMVLSDGAGQCDSKILAVPLERLHPYFAGTTSYRSLPGTLLDQIGLFLSSLEPEPGRRLSIERWGDAEEAADSITAAVAEARRGHRRVTGAENRGWLP